MFEVVWRAVGYRKYREVLLVGTLASFLKGSVTVGAYGWRAKTWHAVTG